VTGLISVYSATFTNNSSLDFFKKQLIFVIIGIIFMIITSYTQPKYILNTAYIFYAISILLLILVLILGRRISGNKSWFSFGGFGIQPSEFAKVATILALSAFLNKEDRDKKINNITTFLKACLFVFIPVVLIMRQPDMGTALVFLSFIVPMFFYAGLSPFIVFSIISPIIMMVLAFLNMEYFYIGIVILLIILIFWKQKKILSSVMVFIINIISGFSVNFIYNHLQPYQQNRILSMINPLSDPLGTGYNLIQAKVAIGSGGFFGKGFLQGTQTQLKFIPEQWTDFIFCVVGEEFGFIGSVILVLLFCLLIIKIINNAFNSRNNFLANSCIGFASILFFHLIVNVGMTMGIMPVIGIPLPLVSYGISSMFSFLIMIGICMNTYRYKNLSF
jgi:rod shape determining protein RodA